MASGRSENVEGFEDVKGSGLELPVLDIVDQVICCAKDYKESRNRAAQHGTDHRNRGHQVAQYGACYGSETRMRKLAE